MKNPRNAKKSAIERRALARALRAFTRLDSAGHSVTEAAAAYGIARTDYYRLVHELEAWEADATDAEELAENGSGQHLNLSGRMILDYIQGNSDALVAKERDSLRLAVDDRDPLLD